MSAEFSYLDGWYGQEHDGVQAFRWMSRQATGRVPGLQAGGSVWLRITAVHACGGPSPVLSVSVDGVSVSQRTIGPVPSQYVFAVEAVTDGTMTFTLDRTFRVAGDGRDLGIMVRAIEVLDLEDSAEPVDAEGWYEWEYHEYFPFRWMGAEARLLVPTQVRRRGRFGALPVYTDIEDGSQVLVVEAAGTNLAEIRLLHGWHVYDFALPNDSTGQPVTRPLDLTLRPNRLIPSEEHPSDPRDLSVRVGLLEVHDDGRRHAKVTAFCEDALGSLSAGWAYVPVSKAGAFDRLSPLVRANRNADAYMHEGGEGWHGWEFQDHIPFRWLEWKGTIHVPGDVRRGRRFCVFALYSDYDDLSQVLTVSAAGTTVELPLVNKWSYYSFAVPPEVTGDIDIHLSVNKLLPQANLLPNDDRTLSVRVGPVMFHDDEARHEGNRFFYENAVLNHREMLAGATELKSFPLDLGIDLYGKCNIKPSCVYCPWDDTKQLEGENTGTVVDETTLADYGRFFHAARALVNCSFGEPLLHPRLEQILEFTAKHEKVVEISTNGQAFTPASVRALAGKPVLLYVSLDSASPATYARLRNERWHEIVTGLTFLREARRHANGLPKLNMVFMPMRANLDDLEAFFKLCRLVDADLLVLRPLNWVENPTAVADRGGYHFEYARELLSVEELEAVADRCDEYADQYEVLVANQFDFGRVKKPGLKKRAQGAEPDGQPQSK